jgi:hypothetical protein
MHIRGSTVVWTCALVLAIGACSKQADEPAAASEQAMADAAPAAAPAMPEANLARRAQAGPPASGAAATAPVDAATQLQSAATSQDDGERKFIRTATVEFRVRDVYRGALAIEDLTAQHGGFVVRNDIRTQVEAVETQPSGDGKLVELATYTVNGTLQVRVPSARTQAFLRALASQVEFLDSRDYAAVDAQFELLRQRLAYARYQEAQRAQGEAAQGPGKLGDKVDAIGARSESQAQRDEALIAQRSFEDRVAYATIDLSIHQTPLLRRTERMDVDAVVRRDGPGFFTRLGHALAQGWYGLLDGAIALSRLWPLWLLLAASVFVVRRWRRR